jgi:quinol monooxygenase YgiN
MGSENLEAKEDDNFMNLTVEIRARSGQFLELYQTLQGLVPMIRKERGCRNCRIYRDLECEDVFSLSAHWEVRASLEKYMQSSSGCALLGAIELLSETARVRIDDAPWQGIETLRRMKRKQREAFT